MARTIDHVERISESFDALEPVTQADMVAELFSRLSPVEKEAAIRRIHFHLKLCGGMLAAMIEPQRRNGAKSMEEK